MGKVSNQKHTCLRTTLNISLVLVCVVSCCLSLLGAFLYISKDSVTISSNGTNITFKLIQNVSLEDNSIEKLSQKLEVTSSNGQTGELGSTVKVTANSVMFDYSIDEKKYYFEAINKTLKQTDSENYATVAGDLTIYGANTLATFRDNVNSGVKYDKVYLSNDVDLNNANFGCIGYERNNTFSGTFYGQGYTIKNLTIVKNNGNFHSGTGFFGYIENSARIYDLNLENVTMILDNSWNNSRGCGIGILVGHHGYFDEDTYYHNPVSSSLTITNCSVKNASINIPKGLSAGYKSGWSTTYWSGSLGIGGLLGSSKASVYINNCYVDCDISIGDILGASYYTDALHGVGGIMGARIGGLYSSPARGSITISDCLYTGAISLAGGYTPGAGGILGIANCLASNNFGAYTVSLCNNFVDMTTSGNFGAKHPICSGNRVPAGNTVSATEFNYGTAYSNKNVSPECKPYAYIEMVNNYFGFITHSKPSNVKSMFPMYYDSSISEADRNYSNSKYYGKYSGDNKVAQIPTLYEG